MPSPTPMPLYVGHNAFTDSHATVCGSQCLHQLPCHYMWVIMPSPTPMPLYVGHNTFTDSHSTVCGSYCLHRLPFHCMWVIMLSLTPIPLFAGHSTFTDSNCTIHGSQCLHRLPSHCMWVIKSSPTPISFWTFGFKLHHQFPSLCELFVCKVHHWLPLVCFLELTTNFHFSVNRLLFKFIMDSHPVSLWLVWKVYYQFECFYELSVNKIIMDYYFSVSYFNHHFFLSASQFPFLCELFVYKVHCQFSVNCLSRKLTINFLCVQSSSPEVTE